MTRTACFAQGVPAQPFSHHAVKQQLGQGAGLEQREHICARCTSGSTLTAAQRGSLCPGVGARARPRSGRRRGLPAARALGTPGEPAGLLALCSWAAGQSKFPARGKPRRHGRAAPAAGLHLFDPAGLLLNQQGPEQGLRRAARRSWRAANDAGARAGAHRITVAQTAAHLPPRRSASLRRCPTSGRAPRAAAAALSPACARAGATATWGATGAAKPATCAAAAAAAAARRCLSRPPSTRASEAQGLLRVQGGARQPPRADAAAAAPRPRSCSWWRAGIRGLPHRYGS